MTLLLQKAVLVLEHQGGTTWASGVKSHHSGNKKLLMLIIMVYSSGSFFPLVNLKVLQKGINNIFL